MNEMDIAKLKVADLKALLAEGRDIEALLSAMKGDDRVSVRKLADTLLGLDSDTFYIYHVAAVMVDNLRRLLLGINLSDKAVMDFDFPGVGFPIQFVYQDTVDKLMDVFIGQFLYVAVFPDNLNKP